MVRRGLKSEIEDLALEVRSELGLAPQARLLPLDLAKHLEIPVLSLSGLQQKHDADADAVAMFTGSSREAFSAFTVTDGVYRMIVVNESHSEGRQANSLAHELAHILLEHEPAPSSDEYGHRFWNADIEEEANLLAAALLVPREGARILLESGRSEAQAAKHFGVSLPLFQWRARQTGVLRQMEFARARREAGLTEERDADTATPGR